MITKTRFAPAFSSAAALGAMLLGALAFGAVACGGSGEDSNDVSQSGGGALSAGGASGSAGTDVVAAGEYANGGKHLYVTETALDHLVFVIDVASPTGTGTLGGEADRVKESVFRFVSDQCTLDFTQASGRLLVSETQNCSALHGASVDFQGTFSEALGAPRQGAYSSANGTLEVKALQTGALDFELKIASPQGHTGDVAGHATSSTAQSVFTFDRGDCALKLHFGQTALVVEQSATCASESGGLSFSDVYGDPAP